MHNTIVIILIFIYAIIATSADLSFLLLHNNDMHSRFEETAWNSAACKKEDRGSNKCLGGFARTIYEVKRSRKLANEGIGPKVLFVNAGDMFSGSNWFTIHKWKICADFVNLLRPDVMSLGNHEFDLGPDELSEYIDNITPPVICANCDFSENPNLMDIKKSIVLEIDKTKIGIIGYLTRETLSISNTGNVKILDEIEALKNESERLDKNGIKIIIALGHSGFTVDKEIAAQVPLVDIVVGGHTNTFLYNGRPVDDQIPEDLYPKIVTQPSGKKVPVVQAYAYTKYLGRLNVTFDDNGDLVKFFGLPLLMSSDIPQDYQALVLLETYRRELEELEVVLGYTRVLLDASVDLCRYQECNLGNMIADGLVYHSQKYRGHKFWTDYPIGLIHGGAIKNSIDSTNSGGKITKAQLLEAQPYKNRVIRASVTGSVLTETLEAGIRNYGGSQNGEFLQVSGIHVVFNADQPPGSRVESVKVLCGQCLVPEYEDIVEDKIYNITTIEYLLKGRDGYEALKNGHFNKRVDEMIEDDVTARYVQEQREVYAGIEGRIIIKSKIVSASQSCLLYGYSFSLLVILIIIEQLLL